jgi:hypothetical protein
LIQLILWLMITWVCLMRFFIFPLENQPFEKSIVFFFFLDPLGMSKIGLGIRYYPLFLWSITIHYGSFFQPVKWHDTGKLNATQEGSQSYQKRLGEHVSYRCKRKKQQTSS